MSTPTVLIVDDHKVVAEGLMQLLGNRFRILGTIADGSLAVSAVDRLRPDIVLLDLSLPNVSGLDVLRGIREVGLKPTVIVLTMHADAQLAVEALRAGASGFVLKESSSDELLTALDVVLAGGTYLAMGLTKEIVTVMVGAETAPRVDLTAQQREVLRLVVRGQRAKEIAGALQLSTRSVEAIKYRMMHRLKVHSTAELVRCAVERRLVF
jgi:DNA-binding NarL/FixJ family response regulator